MRVVPMVTRGVDPDQTPVRVWGRRDAHLFKVKKSCTNKNILGYMKALTKKYENI
jgi:hypothetical protein